MRRRAARTVVTALTAFVVGGCGGNGSEDPIGTAGVTTASAEGAGVQGVGEQGAGTNAGASDLGTVMELGPTGPPDLVDTVTGNVTTLDLPCCEVFPQPFTADTVLVSDSNGVSSAVRILDRDFREQGSLTLPADLDLGRTFLSPDGQLLLDRTRNAEVRVWTLAGEPVAEFRHPRSFEQPEAGWTRDNRIVLRQEDRRGLLVGPPGGTGTDFVTLGLSPDTDGAIFDFDASPNADRIAFVLRERDGLGGLVNSVRVVDFTAGTVHTVVSTPAYPHETGEAFDPYDSDTDSHRIHNVFWHHEGQGLFVLVGASLFDGAPPAPLVQDVVGWNRSIARLYFVGVNDAEGLTIDNADPANTSSGIVVVPRVSDDAVRESWSRQADYLSFPRR